MLMHKIFFKSSESMEEISDNCVKMMITSPPYWNLKNYEVDNQIGYKEDYKTYLNRVYKVWKETFRVLTDDGIAIININTKSYKKNLVLIPYDFIKQMEKIGFRIRDVHYWHKSSGIPRPSNLGDHFEYFLIFTKSDKYSINDFSFFDYKINKKIPKINIWNINKKFGSVGKKFMVHPAIFPVPYIKRMIEIFTNPEEIILDPFLGSGTSLIAAELAKRRCIGFELNKEGYLPMIKDRLEEDNLSIKNVELID
ncbi:MAG: site-specific DNA-methyltransferase [Candidatus Firestonebacteria bacterium]